MLGKRTMFKKFRKWFEPCYNNPMRLNEEQFIGLLEEMLGVREYGHDNAVYVLKKLGFQERKNIKGTFYIRPTLEFYLEANKRRVPINRLLFSYWKQI